MVWMRVNTCEPYRLWMAVQAYAPCDMYVPVKVATRNPFRDGEGYQWVMWDGLRVPSVVYVRRLSWQP